MQLSKETSASGEAAPLPNARFSNQLKLRARELGFDKVGIVSAQSLSDEGQKDFARSRCQLCQSLTRERAKSF